MPHRVALAVAVLAWVGAAAAPVRAQEAPLHIVARGGAALPVGSFRTGPVRGGDVALAPALGVHLVYQGPFGWGSYLGFGQDRFDCAADGCPGGEYVATGWGVGAHRSLGGSGWLRAGLLFARVEGGARPSGDEDPVTSSLSLGAELAAGLRIPLKGRLGLSPAVRYGWLNTRFPLAPVLRMRWVAADLGVTLNF